MRLQLSFFSALAAAVMVVSASSPAKAISISGVTITTNAPNTVNFANNGLSDYSENQSTTSILDSGGTSPDSVASTVDAQTRYAAMVGADSGILTNRTRSATSDYKVTFTVTALPTMIYDLKIDTSRLGALTTINESSGANQATASVSAVTGKLNGSTNLNLGAVAATTTANAGGDFNIVLNQTNTLTLLGYVGTQTFTLDFDWTMTADSTCTGTLCNTVGTDEAAVRLGLAGATASATTAEDYPGVGSRTAANDGHFVTILATVTVVPEPGTLMLLGAGFAGLAVAGTRKRS